MSNNPDEQPFAGIPLFGDLAKAMAGQGPLQWDVARQVAISTATNGTNTEANVDPSSRVSLEQLAPIADMHVRNYTGLTTCTSSGSGTALPNIVVTNHSTWVHHTLESYKPLFTQLATALSNPNAETPQPSTELDIETDQITAMMSSLNKMMAPAMMGMSIGSMIGQLSLRAFGQYDLPIPREPRNQLLLVASNVEQFANDWSIAVDDMRMWVLIHELTSHVVLSVDHVRDSINQQISKYIAGFRPNPNALMERLTTMDLGTTDPMAMMQKFLTDPTIILGAVRSPEQERQAPVLDAMIASIIGYIDHSVDAISSLVLGGGAQIAEAVRRRRVESAPHDSFVEQLLGLRLTRQQVERGHDFASGVTERAGHDGLSQLFDKAGNLPTPNELDAPGLWLARIELQDK
ncbi:MAG: zinc-dependent metalloprotease [Actinobacteria bacterium]|nr:zinc-dependent metalloprotease [Actinomycetota bacterium]